MWAAEALLGSRCGAGVTIERGGIVALRMVHGAATDALARKQEAERVVAFWEHPPGLRTDVVAH